MVKVERYGKTITVDNPARPGERTTQTVVVFTEEGRPDLGTSVSRSAALLSRRAGKPQGLRNIRTHSQPILADELQNYPIGSEHPFFINRTMYSTPQMESQRNVQARMYEGNVTYFVTELGESPEVDLDKRMSLETFAHLQPLVLLNARIGTANVQQEAPSPTPQPPVGEPVTGAAIIEHENLGQTG